MILALETSSQAASCALWDRGKLIAEAFANGGLTHSQTIMPMVESMLDSARVKLEAVDLFAVSNGPGSFTGLRIGLSAVKGMAMALERPCAAISTLHGLAENVRDFPGCAVPVLDARRGQVYTALFRQGPGGPDRLREDEALSLDQLRERLTSLEGPKLLVGDGAALSMEALGPLPGLSMASPQLRYQRAASVAALAEALPADRRVSAGDLLPAYLRLPQAERELAERNKRIQEDRI